MRVYADMFALVNLVVNFCLLCGAAALTGTPVRLWRLLLGGAVGAAYATVALLLPAARGPWPLLLGGLLMLLATFWPAPARRLAAAGGGLAVLAALTAGLALAWRQLAVPATPGAWPGPSLATVLGGAGLTAFLAGRWWRSLRAGAQRRRDVLPVEVRLDGARMHLRARVDSGNDACEPLSGRPVTLISEEAGALPERPARGWARRVRVVPVRGLGAEPMLLAALRVDLLRVRDGGQVLDVPGAYVATCPGTLDAAGRWDALLPAALLETALRGRVDAACE